MPNGVGRSFGTSSTLHLIQNVSDVRNHGIETNRQHQRDIRVRAPDRQQTQNLDFASGEVFRKSDSTVPRMQQGTDIDNQAGHFKSTRELLALPQLPKAQPPFSP